MPRKTILRTIDIETALTIADQFKILSDPTRVRLLGILADQELCVSDLARLLNMEQSAVSHQLRTLRSLNLVQYRKVGRQVYYHLHDPHIQDLLLRSLEQSNPTAPQSAKQPLKLMSATRV